MKLVYYHDALGNFGDDLNPWLWNRLLPGFFDGREDVLFLGIGTILRQEIPAEPIKLVFGSGVGYGVPPTIDERWRFYCVRGPLTAERLGISPDLAITDSAALVARVFDATRYRRRGVAFMPHHASVPLFDWAGLCRQIGIRFLDPAAGVDRLLRAIASSELLIAEAMHAAIVADALRVPWVPAVMYDHINDFKWTDWCRSLELDYAPVTISSVYDNSRRRAGRRLQAYLRRVRRTGSLTRQGIAPVQEESPREARAQAAAELEALARDESCRRLSTDGMLALRVGQLADALDRVRADWKR